LQIRVLSAIKTPPKQLGDLINLTIISNLFEEDKVYRLIKS
jgi:hypothetical protein